MRLALTVAATLALAILPGTFAPSPRAIAAEGCTGPNCSQTDQGGGHQCEREKKEQVTS